MTADTENRLAEIRERSAELNGMYRSQADSNVDFLLAEIERLKVDLDRYRYAVSWASADAWDGGKEIRQRLEWARDMDRRESFTENEIAAICQSYLRTKP